MICKLIIWFAILIFTHLIEIASPLSMPNMKSKKKEVWKAIIQYSSASSHNAKAVKDVLRLPSEDLPCSLKKEIIFENVNPLEFSMWSLAIIKTGHLSIAEAQTTAFVQSSKGLKDKLQSFRKSLVDMQKILEFSIKYFQSLGYKTTKTFNGDNYLYKFDKSLSTVHPCLERRENTIKNQLYIVVNELEILCFRMKLRAHVIQSTLDTKKMLLFLRRRLFS